MQGKPKASSKTSKGVAAPSGHINAPSSDGQAINDKVRFTEKTIKEGLRQASRHHIESFDYAMQVCLPRICQNLLATEISSQVVDTTAGTPATGKAIPYPFKKMTIWFESLELKKPVKTESTSLMSLSQAASMADSDKLYPTECRLRSLTYSAPLYATIARKIDSEPEEKITLCLGDIPVMVRSNFCHLHGLDEIELVKRREDMAEFGGYFIINGNERLVRMLIMTKRNYPIAFQRGTFINRGRLFTPFAVLQRCVREDLFSQTLTLHYLSDGNCMMRLIYQNYSQYYNKIYKQTSRINR